MIRDFRTEDLDNVMKIWFEANVKAHDFIPEKFWEDNFEYVKMILPLAEIMIYEESNIIKGFVGITDKSYIAGLFVANEYQSAGIGSALIEKCKQIYPILKLDVYVKNIKAVSFYKNHRFIIEHEKENEDTKEREYSMTWMS